MPLLDIKRPRHYFIEYDTVGLKDTLLKLLFNADISKGTNEAGKMNVLNLNDHIINNTVQTVTLDKKLKYAVIVNTLIHSAVAIEFARNHFLGVGAALMKIRTLDDYKKEQTTISKFIEIDPLESYINTSFATQFVIENWYFNGKTTQLLDIKSNKIQKYDSYIAKEEKKIEKQDDKDLLDQLTFNLKLTQGEKDLKDKVILPHQQEKGVINYVPDEFDDFDEDDEIDVDADLDF